MPKDTSTDKTNVSDAIKKNCLDGKERPMHV